MIDDLDFSEKEMDHLAVAQLEYAIKAIPLDPRTPRPLVSRLVEGATQVTAHYAAKYEAKYGEKWEQ